MRIILDKYTNELVRHHLLDHTVHTARYLGWDVLSNGQLLDRAEQAGYDLLISADKDMWYTQNFSKRQISVIFIRQNRPLTKDFIAEIREAIEREAEYVDLTVDKLR